MQTIQSGPGLKISRSSFMATTKYLFFSGAAMAGVLLFFEIFIRLFVYGVGPKYIFDPDLGYRYGAGTKIFNGVEGFGTIEYVADGEVATPYSGGKNVVVLGDSHTQAIQVDDIDNFVSIAESKLHSEGYSVDLHNYAGMGVRIPDYIYFADYIKERYHPEIMVIQLSVDDFFGNSFAPDQPSYFSFSADSTLTLKHNPPIKKHIPFIESLNQRSALTTFAYERLYRISYLVRDSVNKKDENKQGDKQETTASQPDIVSTDVMKAELQMLIEAYPDIPIVIILLPFTPRIQNSDIQFQENEYYQVLAETIQGTERLYLVDPRPQFDELVAMGKFPRGFQNTLPGTSHLNIYGHQIVGKLLALVLEQIEKNSFQ